MNYGDQIEWDPDKKIEDVDGLFWVKGDRGSWEGPQSDWNTSHRAKVVDECVAAGRVGIALQAGGNMGLYPKLLAKRFRRVYTFEPDGLNFACLCRNVEEENVIKINAALGDVNVLASMIDVDGVNRGASRVNFSSPMDGIPTLLVDQLGLRELDLLWLDVERSEGPAVAGAEQTLVRCRPLLVVLESTNGPTEKLLDSLGYKMTGSSSYDKVYRFSG